MRKYLILTLVLSSLLLIGCGDAPVEEEKAIAVSVQGINNQGIENTNVFSGTTKIKDETSVTVEMGGTIEDMYVTLGDYVNKGDKLLEIKGTDVENSVKQATAALELARASYDNTSNSAENQNNQLETNLNVAKITYEEAKKSYDIYTELVKAGAIAENDSNYRQIVQGFQKSKENLDLAQKSYDSGAIEGTKELAQKQLNQAQVAYDIAVSTRDKLTLVSPVDGIITAKNFDINEIASQGQPAFIISSMNTLQIDISVTQADIDKFNTSQSVNVTIGDQVVEGTVRYVPTVVNSLNSLYTVEILVDNSNEEFKAGMSAEVEVMVQEVDNTIAVPKKAILEEGGTKYVFKVNNDNRATKTEVTTGTETDSKVEIISGIDTDDTIVIGGLSLISDNTKLFPVAKED